MVYRLLSVPHTMQKINEPELFRERVRGKLAEKMRTTNDAKNLEIGIFNYALKEAGQRKVVKKWDNPFFVQIYVDRLRSIMSNLRPEVLDKVEQGEIMPHVIAFMTHQELCPEKWEAMIQEKIKRDKHKFETTLEASTDTFTCRKCRSKKCTYYELQTRSADEPMTIFCTCNSCGKRFIK